MKTLVVYSGGMDSFTLLNLCLSDKNEVKAISFNYGQRHSKELVSAINFTKEIGIHHAVIDIQGVTHSLDLGSALINPGIPVPKGHYEDESMRMTVVPGRNLIMSSMAMAHASAIGFDRIALGVHAGDHAIYPDCRPRFIDALRSVGAYFDYNPIAVFTPFIMMSKGEIAEIGKSLGLDYSKTWTCYVGGAEPCGECGACQERKEAMEFAGIAE